MNTEKLKQLHLEGKTPTEIAAVLSSDPARFPLKNLFPGGFANALAASGHADPAGLLDRLIAGIKLVAAQRPSVDAIATGFTKNEGTLDFGSPLVRATIAEVGASEDTDFTTADYEAIAVAITVPDPITAGEVESALRDIEFREELTAIATVLEGAKNDELTIAQARQLLVDDWSE